MKFKERIFSGVVDRPVGFEDSFGNVYPINYGYIPELMGEMAKSKMFILFLMISNSLWKSLLESWLLSFDVVMI